MGRPRLPVWDEFGRGEEVILCLSGFASANWMFRSWLEPLHDSYRFLLPENRGMGRSPPATTPYTIDDLAQDALHLLDHLAIDRCSVIGLSMGGFIAQRLVNIAPQRVNSLVMLCTSSGGEKFQPLFPLMTREQIEAIYRLDAETRIRAALSPQICPVLQERYPTVFAEVLRQRLQHQEERDQVLLQYDAVADFLRLPQPLAEIHCPTLLLSADQDLLVPVANAQLLAQSIPQAELQVIAETDHLFFLEKAATVCHLIGNWLAEKGDR
ncbi:MAG: alpha/beta hydrolase [Magnetococcales bacterium]|nr:alpha/beta hydrolase [Magnetococcales bacterium]